MNQNFTILWIEDKKRVIISQVPEIENFLESEGFELYLLTDNTGDEYQHFLDENKSIDLVVTDYNISEEMKGTDIVEYVRDKGLLIDILFYSVHDDLFKNGDIYDKLGHYGLIDICEGKDVVEPLKDLIIKNIKRCQDIVFLRGFIISKSVELELKLNEYFAQYFEIQDDLKEDFHNFILESSYVPMAGKKRWLSQILEKNNLKNHEDFAGLLNKLDFISTQRNLLAHCKKGKNNPNTLISTGDEEIFDKERLNKILEKIDVVSDQLDKLMEIAPEKNK